MNLGCGYYRQHTSSEYVIVEEVFDAIKAGYELIMKLGVKKYTHKKVEKKSILTERTYGQVSYDDYDFEDYYLDDYDEASDSITDLVISLYNKGVDEVEIKEEVADFLRGMY